MEDLSSASSQLYPADVTLGKYLTTLILMYLVTLIAHA